LPLQTRRYQKAIHSNILYRFGYGILVFVKYENKKIVYSDGLHGNYHDRKHGGD